MGVPKATWAASGGRAGPHRAPGPPMGPIPVPTPPNQGQRCHQGQHSLGTSAFNKKPTNNSHWAFPRRACLEDEQEAKRSLLPNTSSHEEGLKANLLLFFQPFCIQCTPNYCKVRAHPARGRAEGAAGEPRAGGCTALCLRCGCCGSDAKSSRLWSQTHVLSALGFLPKPFTGSWGGYIPTLVPHCPGVMGSSG